jgi:hypothetical protein
MSLLIRPKDFLNLLYGQIESQDRKADCGFKGEIF